MQLAHKQQKSSSAREQETPIRLEEWTYRGKALLLTSATVLEQRPCCEQAILMLLRIPLRRLASPHLEGEQARGRLIHSTVRRLHRVAKKCANHAQDRY